VDPNTSRAKYRRLDVFRAMLKLGDCEFSEGMNRFKQAIQGLEEMRLSFPPEWKQPIKLDAETSKDMVRIAERMRQVPAEMAELSVELAKRGWYLWMDMPFKFLYAVRRALREKRLDLVDEALIGYFKKENRRIESIILQDFPNRAAILKPAFRAHRKRGYALSVPVFLSQADGICAELLGVGFYSRKKGSPRTAVAAERFTGSDLTSSLLEPLRVSGALNAFENERHQYPDVLNRHEVLHGKAVDYATPVNGFRTFSLLAYVGSALVTAKEYQEFQDERNRIGN
jgi:hypothetical protein